MGNGGEGADEGRSGGAVMVIIYKAVIRTVFLYGSEIWVAKGLVLAVLEDFHHQVTRRIAGKTSWGSLDVGW